MSRPKYVASCSGGKDSVETLLLAAQHNEPLDEAVFSEVMFDKDTSGEVPEHRDFIYDRLKPFCEKELGIKFTILHADKTYDDVFHHVITRGPHKGESAALYLRTGGILQSRLTAHIPAHAKPRTSPL